MDFQTALECANFALNLLSTTKEVNPLFIKISSLMKAKFSKYTDEVSSSIQQVPDKDIQEPNYSLLIPAINESFYYLNEDTIRKMFVKLITSAFDKSKNEYSHPGFIGIIKQLSPQDARLLSFINETSNLNGISIADNQREYRIIEMKFTSFEDIKQCALSIDNLTRLGLIVVESKNALSYIQTNDENSGFIEIDHCKSYTSNKDVLQLAKENNCEAYSVKAYLTVLGESFLKVCV